MNNRKSMVATLVAGLACAAAAAMAPEDASRAERFANPPASARILPIHHGRPDAPERIDAELKGLVDDGFGGMACNVKFSESYLERAADWEMVRYTVRKARAAGLALWLYDECGYPSGTARDKVLRGHPEWQARGVLIAVTNAAAGARVELQLPPGIFRRAVACPLLPGGPDTDAVVVLDSCAIAGKVIWTAPAGGQAGWRVYGITEDLLYESTHSALSLSFKNPYINLLMAEPTARFIELTHARYAKELGDDLKAFTSTFTDEPSLMSCWMRSMPYYVLPWCPDLPADYRARTGRDLLADVPAILDESASGMTPKLRCAFWNMVGDRVSRNYMGQITDWTAKHGILSGGHLLAEESISVHTAYYGDFLRCLRALSAPSIDCLNSIPAQVPWVTAQFAGSAGALNGSRRVMCEASDHCQKYRGPNDKRPIYQVSEDEVMGALNRLVWGGVNTITSYYRWEPFSREQRNRINTAVGRTITLMSEGHNGAEVALLYPADTLMATYQPCLRGGGGMENARVANCFRACGSALFAGRRPFMFADARALAEAKVDGDSLAYGDLRWRVVVLPRASTLPVAVLRNLHAFWRAGGMVVAAERCPVNTPAAFPDAETRRLCAEMFGEDALKGAYGTARSANGGRGVLLARQQVVMLSDVLDALVEPAVTLGKADPRASLRVARRRTAEGDILFLLNDSGAAWRGSVRLCGGAAAELWDPRTGAHGPAQAAKDGISLDLPPFGAVLLTTRTPLAQARGNFDEKEFAPAIMPFGAPVERVGNPSSPRVVESSIDVRKDGSAAGRAKLLKGGVDTFLFVPFVYASSPCVEGMRGITFESDVKDVQRYAPELLVFAVTTDGTMFLAPAGRSLSVRGRERSYVPFSAFSRHAATGKSANLDPAAIREFRIGFGGYFGEAGQTINFEVTPPSAYR